MKRWMVVLLIGVPIMVVGAYLLLRATVLTPKSEAATDATVETATVERGNIQVNVDAVGTIEPLNVVSVNSKANGEILELLVDEGDYVERDDVIARIETTYVQVDVDQAAADLAAAKARYEQSEINISLQREQVEVQISQNQKSLAEAEKKLEQLQEQIRLEKQANARAIANAKNDLEMAKMRLQLKTSGAVRAESIRRSEASVAQAKVSMQLAQKEYDRKKPLHEKGYLSRSELDTEEAQLESARAQYQSAVEQHEMVIQPASEMELALAQAEIQKSQFSLQTAEEKLESEKTRDMEIELQQNRVTQAQESLNLALANRAQITVKEKDLENARATQRRAEVTLDLANERLEDTTIRAPISGTILEKLVEEGQVITSTLSSVASSGGTTLVNMADLSTVYVVTEVDETDIGKIQVGQSVQITIEAYPDQPFQGEVLKIAPQGKVVQNVTTFEVTTQLTNVSPSQSTSSRRMPPEGAMFERPGMGRGEGRPGPQMAMQPETEAATEKPAESDSAGGDFFDMVFSEKGLDALMADDTDMVGEPAVEEASNAPFLKPGMNATVQISVADKQNVLLLPNQAILAFGNRKMVRLMGEDGLPAGPQPITTGVSSFDTTEVLSGVEEGQVVALGGMARSAGGGPPEEFRRMMQNPASTMRRMQGGGGPPR